MERTIRRPTLTRRLVGRFALTLVALLALLGIVLDRTLATTFLDDLTRSLTAQARAIRRALPAGDEDLQRRVREIGGELGVRISVIRTDGVVLADSSRLSALGIENHADRPEVRAALDGRVGVATRVSATVRTPFRYVALPPERGTIVRVALPTTAVQARLGRIRGVVGAGLALAAMIGVGMVVVVARGLTRPLSRLTGSVQRLSAGELRERARVEGSAELALLAETLNGMAAELEARIAQGREEQRQRDLILSSMEEGIALFGADAGLGYGNPAAERLLGAMPQSVRTLTPTELRRLVEDSIRSGEPRAMETTAGHPGTRLRAAVVPLRDEAGALLILRDVTASHRVEAMRRDFVANASHELKTPVASIRASAETLRGALDDDPAAATTFARRLDEDAQRLSRLVSDLLDLSRLETEQAPPRAEVRLDELLRREAERLHPQAEDAGVELEVRADPVTIRGSIEDLALLVRNLLDNAIRFTPSGGRVETWLERDGEEVEIHIRDTGVGIPSKDLPRVFERFYRVDPARSRATGGTGLGLAIARHVAEHHGGRIHATSELGRGSTFTVRLPAAPSG